MSPQPTKRSANSQTKRLGLNVIFVVIALAALTMIAASNTAYAAGGSYDNDNDAPLKAEDPLRPAKKAIGDERYADAIALLDALLESDPDNADIHNLLGFSSRKIGEFDAAFEHYQTALTLDPDHIRAHEYLGELYLQTDQLAKAEQQLERVNELCSLICKERRMLRKTIKQYKADNA